METSQIHLDEFEPESDPKYGEWTTSTTHIKTLATKATDGNKQTI